MDDRDRAGALGQLDVSRETVERLDAFVALLRRWQGVRNLVARSTLGTIWSRHIVDSAQLLDHVPAQARELTDLGAGAGFPGLVLAILLRGRPGLLVTLIESDQRKAAFLRAAARELDLPVRVRAERIEVALLDPSECDVVTARALAPLDDLLTLAAPLIDRGALGLFPKGENVADELTASRAADRFRIELRSSRTRAGAVIVIVRRNEPPSSAGQQE